MPMDVGDTRMMKNRMNFSLMELEPSERTRYECHDWRVNLYSTVEIPYKPNFYLCVIVYYMMTKKCITSTYISIYPFPIPLCIALYLDQLIMYTMFFTEKSKSCLPILPLLISIVTPRDHFESSLLLVRIPGGGVD